MKYFHLLIILLFVSCSASKQNASRPYFDGANVGCGNFTIYHLTKNNQEYLTVRIESSALESGKIFDLSSSLVLKVSWSIFSEDVSAFLCNDIMSSKRLKPTIRQAKSGRIEFVMEEDGLQKLKNKEPYTITVILKNIEFEGLKIKFHKIENVQVGWLPG